MVNTVWSLKDSIGNEVSSFPALATMGVNHFKNMFCAQQEATIAEVIKIVIRFPHLLYEDEFFDLMTKLFEEEVNLSFKVFKNIKS